jgi:hypothetical protein
MKKIAFLLIPILVLVSCTKDFIDKYPKGSESDLTYFDTEDQCRMAVNAIYDPLGWQNMYQRATEVLDMLSDEAQKGGNPSNVNAYKADMSDSYDLALYRANPTNTTSDKIWKTAYIIIARANTMLNRTAAKESIPVYKKMRAEARFLRAYAYFDLVKMFGAVPLVTDVINPLEANKLSNREYGSAAAQIAAVYDYIISELEDIQGVLPMRPDAANFGQASDAAVRAYLAKAYLYRGGLGDFDKAYTIAQQLIIEGESSYGLTPRYQQVFDFDKIANESTIQEIVFAVQYVPGGTDDSRNYESSIRSIDNNPRVFVTTAGAVVTNDAIGYGLVIPTQTLVNAFEAGDPRLDMIAKSKETSPSGIADSIYWGGQWQKIGKMTNGLSTGNYSLKNFLNQASSGGQMSGKDFILMRWAEVLLIGAEAAARTGKDADAITWINSIRERARNSKCTQKALTMADWTFSTSDVPKNYDASEGNLVTVVKKERQKELFCESGTRYFDLLRWNETKGVDGDGISADEILKYLGPDIAGEQRDWNISRKGFFPINIDQIRAHQGNLVQNEGY